MENLYSLHTKVKVFFFVLFGEVEWPCAPTETMAFVTSFTNYFVFVTNRLHSVYIAFELVTHRPNFLIIGYILVSFNIT